jgi:hypothetical protein
VGLARRGDVERIDLLLLEQRRRVGRHGGNTERLGAAARGLRIGIVDRHHARGLSQPPPGNQVMAADHAGAGERHAQGSHQIGHLESAP